MGADDSDRMTPEYAELLERAKELGRVDTDPATQERRLWPRVDLVKAKIAIVVEPVVRVLNISAEGLAFHSDVPFQPGQTLQITLGQAWRTTAKVMSCEIEETDSDLMELRYLVGCGFSDPDAGETMMVELVKAELTG